MVSSRCDDDNNRNSTSGLGLAARGEVVADDEQPAGKEPGTHAGEGTDELLTALAVPEPVERWPGGMEDHIQDWTRSWIMVAPAPECPSSRPVVPMTCENRPEGCASPMSRPAARARCRRALIETSLPSIWMVFDYPPSTIFEMLVAHRSTNIKCSARDPPRRSSSGVGPEVVGRRRQWWRRW